MKKLLAVLVALTMVFALVAACGDNGGGSSSGDLIKVGIVNLHPSESGYRAANVEDMGRVFNEANGYDVLNANYNTLNEQLDAAQQFISEGVDYLLISAADANGWDGVLGAAADAGITVFLFDRMIEADPSLYEAAVVSDMEKEGQMAVDWMTAQNRDGGYKIIHIRGQMSSAAQIGRAGPLEAAVAANADWEIVRDGTGGDTWDPVEAQRIVEAAIEAGEDFNFIYAHNDGMAEGAMRALQAAGITHGVDGDVWIIGFDFNKFALRYVQSGEWNMNVQCSPFQADVIHGFIQTLEAGGTLDLPADGVVINDEIIAEHGRVDDAFVTNFGIGDDPGPRDGSAASEAPADEGSEGGAIKVDVFWYTFADTFLASVRNAMDPILEANPNINHTMHDCESNQAQQTDMVQTAITQGTDLLIVNIVDSGAADAQMNIVNMASAAGIPIIFFNREVGDDIINAYENAAFVGTDADEAGYMQGEAAANFLLTGDNLDRYDLDGNGEISYIMLRGEHGNAEAFGRTLYSVTEANRLLADAGVSLVPSPANETGTQYEDDGISNYFLYANWSAAEAANLMRTALAAHSLTDGSIELILANNDDAALGAIEALMENGFNTGDDPDMYIPVFGVDATDVAVDAINAGRMTGTILQDGPAMAQAIADLADNIANGRELTAGTGGWNFDVGVAKIRIPYAIVG